MTLSRGSLHRGEGRKETFACDICVHISFLAGADPSLCVTASLSSSGFWFLLCQHQSSTDSLARSVSAQCSPIGSFISTRCLCRTVVKPRLVQSDQTKPDWKKYCKIIRPALKTHCSGTFRLQLFLKPECKYYLSFYIEVRIWLQSG